MLRKFFVHISLFFLGLIAVKAQESLNTLIFRGNRSFDKQKYGEATSTFSEAVKKNEKDFGAHYNLGNSLYKIKSTTKRLPNIKKLKKTPIIKMKKQLLITTKEMLIFKMVMAKKQLMLIKMH